MRKSHRDSKSPFCSLCGYFNMYTIFSFLSFFPLLSFPPLFLFIFISALTISHMCCIAISILPGYMCASAFMCECAEASAAVCTCLQEAARPLWVALLKFSVQWSAPVLLAGCVKHIRGFPPSWLMTRFPPLHVPLASL